MNNLKKIFDRIKGDIITDVHLDNDKVIITVNSFDDNGKNICTGYLEIDNVKVNFIHFRESTKSKEEYIALLTNAK